MGKKKLMTRLGEMLGTDKGKASMRRADLKTILTKMKKKEKKLIEEAGSMKKGSDKRKKLQREIDILHAQRKKGLKILKSK